MNYYDIIFWYTGCVAWAVIAVAVLLVVIIVGIIAVGRAYYYQKSWAFGLITCSKHDRQAMQTAIRSVGYPKCTGDDGNKNHSEYIKWLDNMHNAYEKAKKEND